MSGSTSHTDPTRYSFDLENGIRIFFSVGTDGGLRKIGDGSFGVVFEGNDMAGNPVAIKVLYNTQSLRRRTGPIVVDQILEQLENADFPPANVQALKAFLQQHAEDSLSKLVLKLDEKKQELFEAPKASKEEREKWWTLALELIESDPSHTLAVARFRQEMSISRRLLGKYKPGLLGSVVKVSGGTHKFSSSKAARSLQQEFEKLHILPSNYVVVTDLYETSLERLLVNGPGELLDKQPENAYSIRPPAFLTGFSELQRVELEKLAAGSEEELRAKIEAQTNIDESQKKSLISQIYLRVGYELLRVMTFENRIRIILPLIKEIVNGLIPVHSTGLFHLDLKPANVFIRSKTYKEFAAAIGDFGYLDPQIHGQTSQFLTDDPHAELALGTLHYRSPEQRDFFDMCDVVVKVEPDNQVVLEVRDPKFRSTLIEKYDTVVFSKDNQRGRYRIDNIKIDPEPDRPSYLYLLEKHSKTSKDQVFDDGERTQIFLYKTPGLRSDLFGIGAIAYNLLTAGESPEHFYDHIRRFESRANGVSGEVEADVMDSYDRFKHGLREDE